MKKKIDSLDAYYHPPDGDPLRLGRLGVSVDGRIALEVQDAAMLQTLSPVVMEPRDARVVYPSYGDEQNNVFQGLFGLFADSLPDTFGLEIVRGKLADKGFAAGPLEILAYLGEWGRGALRFEPSLDGSRSHTEKVDVAELFDRSIRVQENDVLDLSEPMAHAMGTAGGTRPKAFVVIDENGQMRTLRGMRSKLKPGETSWMIKFDCTGHFNNRIDHETRIEAAYLHAAREAGIAVPEFKGFAKDNRFHLGLRRFDRTEDGSPLHVHTLWGLLQAPTGSEYASYDYLMRAATRLTRNLSAGEQVFRRLVFNVLAGNMDDHPKQHGFLYDGRGWSLAPAYDLTFSERIVGHSMPVLGSVNPARNTLLEFAKEYDVRKAPEILDQVARSVREILESLLDRYGVPAKNQKPIKARIQAVGHFD